MRDEERIAGLLNKDTVTTLNFENRNRRDKVITQGTVFVVPSPDGTSALLVERGAFTGSKLSDELNVKSTGIYYVGDWPANQPEPKDRSVDFVYSAPEIGQTSFLGYKDAAKRRIRDALPQEVTQDHSVCLYRAGGGGHGGPATPLVPRREFDIKLSGAEPSSFKGHIDLLIQEGKITEGMVGQAIELATKDLPQIVLASSR